MVSKSRKEEQQENKQEKEVSKSRAGHSRRAAQDERGSEAAPSHVQNSLQQDEYRVGRGSAPALPWGSPVPFLRLPSSLLPPLSTLITGGAAGDRGGLRWWARSPDCTLLSCMSRLAPFFSSKSVASTLLTAAAQ